MDYFFDFFLDFLAKAQVFIQYGLMRNLQSIQSNPTIMARVSVSVTTLRAVGAFIALAAFL